MSKPLNPPTNGASEALTAVAQRYDRRKTRVTSGLAPLRDKTLLEIGCGSGSNPLQMIQLGFKPAILVGNELLAERGAVARERPPAATRIAVRDAASLDLGAERFDVVFQSTVFTSIPDGEFQSRLARRIWTLVKPGGQVLWYDFTYDNPRNPDVRGVPVARIRQLFPEGEHSVCRLTLAPPITRRVTEQRRRLL